VDLDEADLVEDSGVGPRRPGPARGPSARAYLLILLGDYVLDRDGSLLYYDINALSNFVADATRVIGFDPHARLVDFLQEEVRRCATVTGSRFSAVG